MCSRQFVSTGLYSNFSFTLFYQRWCNCNGVTFYLECTLLRFAEQQPILFKFQAQFIKMKHYAFPGMYLKHYVSAYLTKFHVTQTQEKKNSNSEVRNIPSKLMAVLAVFPPHA